jgi:hypothetical protein
MTAAQSARSLVIVTVLAMLLSIAMSYEVIAEDQAKTASKDNKPGVSDTLEQRGKRLRAAIDDTYQMLINSHALQMQSDISTVAEAYIPAGTSFADAQAILQSAGAKSEYRCQEGICASMKLHGSWFTTVEVLIDLYPDLSGDAQSVVGKVSAMILYTSL